MTTCPACRSKSLAAGPFCTNCGAHLEVDVRSLRRRWLAWALGVAWSVLTLVVIMNYHVGAGTGNADITLYQKDHFLFWEFFWGLCALLAVAATDLALRTKKRSARAGVPSQVLGAGVALFSLFGLLYGVASLGVVAGLVALSARPFAMRVVRSSRDHAIDRK